MQLIAYYSILVADRYKSAACQQTCFPSIGIELYGNVFRAHALYLSSCKICCEPLTPLLHLSDMRLAVPGYTEMLARTMKALVMTLQKLQELYQPFLSSTQSNSSKLFVSSTLPYALQKRWGQHGVVKPLFSDDCILIDRRFMVSEPLLSSRTSLVYMCTTKAGEKRVSKR